MSAARTETVQQVTGAAMTPARHTFFTEEIPREKKCRDPPTS
jgi:hypothetical protein